MIRYSIKERVLYELAGEAWNSKAEERTRRFRELKRFEDSSPIWTEIKQIYMNLQAGKCGYCERKVGSASNDSILHDVEHFRPKSRIRPWPIARMDSRSRGYDFSTGDGSEQGYYLLPYHLLNYLVACKKCNSIYKADYFPIASKRRRCNGSHPRQMASEVPLLVYPIGDIDEDPEQIITFQGMIAVPRPRSGPKLKRARVTIDFFELDVGRDELLYERALLIKALFIALQDLEGPLNAKRRQAAEQTIRLAVSPSSAHTNCARSFMKVYRSDPNLAERYYDAVYAYLETKSH